MAATVNKKYKDRLFRLLFGNESYKENTLALYNALNGTSYTNADDVTIYTIDDVIYIDMKNDVAFILDSDLSLWEQQSTHNPNMPLRGLMYFGKLYDKYITDTNKNVYRKKLVTIPTPKYVVFYNGVEQRPAVEKLRLTDAFIHEDRSGAFEWTATVINLNHPNLDSRLLACKVLADYTTFVRKVQEYKLENNLEEAINRAVNECIKEGILKDILLLHKAEVIELVLTEFNKELYEQGLKEDAWEEGLEEGRAAGMKEGRAMGMEIGRAEGRAEGKVIGVTETLISLMRKGLISLEEAAEEAKMDANSLKDLLDKESNL
ncbi:MAG: hypothetical protein IJ420_00665 [Lachnospiraceae bacterium]|nr:hypothetical protein [Lachnospiraceae bacterium]